VIAKAVELDGTSIESEYVGSNGSAEPKHLSFESTNEFTSTDMQYKFRQALNTNNKPAKMPDTIARVAKTAAVLDCTTQL
jgi:hypothetical protein